MIRLIPRGSALALLAAASTLLAQPARAQEKARTAFGQALAVTRSTGAATVVIFTSHADAKSQQFRDEFDRGPWARHNRGLVQVVGLAIEDDPGLARTMGIVKVPAAKVYGRTAKGVSLLAAINECTTADALAARLVALQIGLEPPGKDDPAVSQASGHGGVQASQQNYAPQPNWPQVQTPAAPQAPAVPQAPALTFGAPTATTTTANVVQVPSQNLLIQQSAPQIIMAPAPAPTVYMAQQPAAAPMMAFAPATAAAPVAGNMLLSVPGAAPAAPVAMAAPVAAAPVAAPVVAAAPVAVAAAPAATVATLTNQSLSLPSSGTRTRVRVRGPGLLAAGMARVGERMVQLGRTRIETIQETTLEAPVAAAPAGGTTTISTTSASPVVPPPTSVSIPVQQQAPPQEAPPQAPPSYPTASPQGAHSRHH